MFHYTKPLFITLKATKTCRDYWEIPKTKLTVLINLASMEFQFNVHLVHIRYYRTSKAGVALEHYNLQTTRSRILKNLFV